MKIRRFYQLTRWLTIFSVMLLNGCSLLNEYYISNHTDAEIIVQMTPRYVEMVELLSGPLITDVRKSVRESLTMPVAFTEDGDSVQFVIPAETTLFIGFSSGGNELFTQLELQTNGQSTVITDDDFAVHDRLVGAIVHVLNVE